MAVYYFESNRNWFWDGGYPELLNKIRADKGRYGIGVNYRNRLNLVRGRTYYTRDHNMII